MMLSVDITYGANSSLKDLTKSLWSTISSLNFSTSHMIDDQNVSHSAIAQDFEFEMVSSSIKAHVIPNVQGRMSCLS